MTVKMYQYSIYVLKKMTKCTMLPLGVTKYRVHGISLHYFLKLYVNLYATQ